ncbi:hypothetical protein [Stutzerimonas stutzeri]|uniref:hypothetical protein n=1 Tax=Stutzerimonas stutzeri TaxID=316 RepID=UPI00210C7520|nr:hypothetical protein [Stutzerimonas stutzeri]MCQ4320817.1 hypothetical protein [Stutzerimonas stutzeri]
MSVPVDPRSKEDGFEHHDAKVRVLLMIGFGLVIALAVSLAAVGLLLGYYHATPEPPVSGLERDRIIPPEPRLETRALGNGQEVIHEAQQRLSRYAWVDREAGVARIPLQRARVLLLERGWPAPVEASGEQAVRLQQAKQRAEPR